MRIVIDVSVIEQFVQLMLEGTLERETTDISREIFKNIKQILIKNGGFVKQFSFSIKPPDILDLEKIYVKVTSETGTKEPIVGGGFRFHLSHLDQNQVRIHVDVPFGWTDFSFASSQFMILVNNLKDVLRHEFEHARQPGESVDRSASHDFKTVLGAAEYFLDEAEIAAFVVGMYKYAKMKKMDLSDVFDIRAEEVLNLLKDKGASYSEANEITKRVLISWNEYAQKRFPRAKLE